jgi:gliding motility-associated-like protein
LFANSNGDADSFHWSTNAQFTDRLNQDAADSTATISPTASGTYYVQATTNDGCPARDSVSVVISLGSIALEGDTLICAADTARLALIGADAGSTITWSPTEAILGGQGTTTIIVAPVESASYSVTVSAPSGCTWTSTFTVAVSPINASSISASVDQAIVLPGTTVQLLATPSEGVTYSWSPAAPLSDPTIADPTALVQATTLFTVAVSDGICTRNASVEVKVYELLCTGPDIFVPNTFTPNGDGSNDQLLVRGRHIERMEFMVFNRWGEKVFETTDRSIGWDGTFEGRPVDPAVFVYHLTAWCVDGQRYFTKGNVTVVR